MKVRVDIATAVFELLPAVCTAKLQVRVASVAAPHGWTETSITPAFTDLAQYWRLLGDPLVTKFVVLAVVNIQDLSQSAAQLEKARAGLRGTNADYLAQMPGSGRAERDAGDFSKGGLSYFGASDTSWEVDLFGRIGTHVSASALEVATPGHSPTDPQRLISGQVALATISARPTAVARVELPA